MPFQFTGSLPAPGSVKGAFDPLPATVAAQSISPKHAFPQPTVSHTSDNEKHNKSPEPANSASTLSWTRPKRKFRKGDAKFARGLLLPSKWVLKQEQARVEASRAGKHEWQDFTVEKKEPAFCDCFMGTRRLKPLKDAAATPPLSGSFPFDQLPPELRNQVYTDFLDVKSIRLETCAHHLPTGVISGFDAKNIMVSKRFASEAMGVLFQSPILVNVCLESAAKAIIHRNGLPSHTGPYLRQLTIVLDFTKIDHESIKLNGARFDWRPFQAMTRLRSLRICGIASGRKPLAKQGSAADPIRAVLQALLERVPSSCEIMFGPNGDDDENQIHDLTHSIRVSGQLRSRAQPATKTVDVETARFAATAKEVERDIVRGCKSGSAVDYRFSEEKP